MLSQHPASRSCTYLFLRLWDGFNAESGLLEEGEEGRGMEDLRGAALRFIELSVHLQAFKET